jgi:hypothetical protein
MNFFKQKHPKECRNCKAKVTYSPFTDIATCGKCGEHFPTGYEDQLRAAVEVDTSGSLSFPKHAVGRAIAYCSAIYGMATHDEQLDGAKIERHFKANNSTFTGDAELVHSGWEGRGLRLRNLNDTRTGFIMVTVKADRAARARGHHFNHIYIIFRGSRSNEGESNPMEAGFSHSNGLKHNVDYAANLTGRQDEPWWCQGRGALAPKIRRGFLELYKSMSNDIVMELDTQLKLSPDATVIVTGHSLGAGLAVVCAHHLQYQRGKVMRDKGPFCFPFCTPRVGNLHFAMDFRTQLASQSATIAGEATREEFKRCVNFVMSNDPVSTQAAHGYLHDRSDDLRGTGTAAANRSFAGKVFYGLTKTENKEIIFYQTPNVYKTGTFGPANIHQYTTMQKYFLGTVLFST